MNGLITLEQAQVQIARQEFIKERDIALADSRLIDSITDDNANEIVGKVYAVLKGLSQLIEVNRKAITAPLDDLKKRIMDYEREIIGEVVSETARIKGLMDSYATKKLQAQREVEAMAEAERQRQIAAQATAEANGEAVVVPEVVPPPMPVPTSARTSSTSVATAWSFEVVDKRQVPDEFLMINETALRATLKAQKAMGLKPNEVNIPGIRVSEVAVTRKR